MVSSAWMLADDAMSSLENIQDDKKMMKEMSQEAKWGLTKAVTALEELMQRLEEDGKWKEQANARPAENLSTTARDME